VLGCYALFTDVTTRGDSALAEPHGAREQKAYSESLARELTGWSNVSQRLISALRENEFCLYAQAIVPLKPGAVAQSFHEILIRLQEEERNLMPPGAFLPLAEEQGLLPELDRWVVNRLLDWVSGDPARQQALYSVNISGATLSDPGFPLFVREALRSRKLREGLLCVEIAEADAAARETETGNLVRLLKDSGCRSALSQFGRSKVSFALLKPLAVDYLKIDGNIVLAMLRDPVALAKIRAITQVARELAMSTVAELVENEETLTGLRAIGVDYAQGFAIAHPRPIEELATLRLGAAP
jgi:EAL domain-containing protein (putative c-di-GMP-specific phosphodiesterase class I)